MAPVEGNNRTEAPITPGGPEFEAVRRHIASAARHYFPELRQEFAVTSSFPYHSTYPIALFELYDGDCRRGIVAKWAPVYGENNEGLTEFTNYAQFNFVYGLRSEARYRCPRPLNFLHEHNVLLTEQEPGSTLRYILCHPLQSHELPGASLECTLQALGEWLRAFHDIDSVRVCPSSAHTHLERATPHLSGRFVLGRDALALLGNGTTQTLQCVHKTVQRATLPCDLRLGALHNDYGPGNIVINRDRATVLDAAWNRPGLQLSDVAYFTTCISLMGALHLRSQSWCRSATEQFVYAYFGDSHHPPELRLMLALLRLEALLRELDRHVRRVSELPSLVQPAARRFFRHAYADAIRSAALDAEMA
jgi:Phosphotransferase enzyme family